MPETPEPIEEFPRQVARTRGFSLGVPRSFTVSPDGERVVYLRTKTGDDPVSCLWVFEVSGAKERLVFDPGEEEAERDLTEAERVRRERARERSSGVTAYATDEAVRRAVFSVGGRMFLADLVEGSARELSAPGAVDDPRLNPAGERIAFVVGGNAAYVREIEGGVRELASPDVPDTYWGLAEFVAAEEMDRNRGHWWSPDGSKLAAAHVDEREVSIRYLSDPTDPAGRAPRGPIPGGGFERRRRHAVGVRRRERRARRGSVGSRGVPVPRPRDVGRATPLTLLVQTRDQRTVSLLEADPASGETSILSEQTDPRWVELVEDAPVRLSDGRVVDVVADPETDTYVLTVAGDLVTPPGLQVREVVCRPARACCSEPPTATRPRSTYGGGRLMREPCGCPRSPGCTRAPRAVTCSCGPRRRRTRRGRWRRCGGRASRSGRSRTCRRSPMIEPRPRFLTLGERELRAALLLPGGREPDGTAPRADGSVRRARTEPAC